MEGDRFRMVIVPEGSSQSSEASVPEGSRQSSVAGRGLGRVPAREPARETTALRGEASVPIALRREARVSTAFRREPTATRREASPMGTGPWRDSWSVSQRDSWIGSRTTAAEDTLHRDLEDRYAASVTPAGAESAEFVEYNEECTVLGRQVNLDMLASHNMLKLFKC